MSSTELKKDKKKKQKKQKSNQSSVDFCIMGADGNVKEVVKKKKRDASGKVKEAAPEPADAAPAPPKAPLSAEEKAAKRARKEAKRAKREAKAEAARRRREARARRRAARAPRRPGRGASSASNPSGVTRLFVGNLPWSITDDELARALGRESLPVIKYITDKESGKFYGSAFVDVGGDAAAAAAAVARNGDSVGGRPMKGGSHKLFIGNIAYEATDDDVAAVFKDVAPEGLSAVRWVTHKDTGDFKGCGYLQFHTVEQADAAVELNGAKLHGRPIRLDYAT
ncbi:hypothetical protein JL721_3829 [Aureococcus anophagefferens]|nr:hypothetical protein JL721_3829 [Aureococcus anophagefferens]